MSGSRSQAQTTVPTGLEALDMALQGGFPLGSSIVLIAPSGDDVLLILQRFLESQQGEKGLLISRSLSSARAVTRLDTGNTKFLISSEAVRGSTGAAVLWSKGYDNLTEFTLDISEALRAVEPRRVVVNILSDILLKQKTLLTRKWLSELLRKLASRKITTVAVINSNLHNRTDVEVLAELFDGNLEIIDFEMTRKRILRINWMHGTEVVQKELSLDQVLRKPVAGTPKVAVAPPHKLPAQLTSFVGREEELAAVIALLTRNDVRVVTLTGPGGTGKSRLGIETARRVLESFRDGIFFVSLAQISDETLLMPTIAQALGVMEERGRPLIETLLDFLQEKQILLLLDNFEQVVSSAPKISQFLGSCSELRLLVTSREPLHIRGEFEFFVPPLAVPDLMRLPSAEKLRQNAAVSLFTARAAAVIAGFALTNENARSIVEICVRLDGLPLALELVAARVKVLSPQDISRRLESGVKILTGGPRDLPERQRTLRGAIAWSYDLLNEAEKSLFRKLSVFAGGCTIEAVEAVCTINAEMEVIDGLSSLVDKSMLGREEHEGQTRFLMLETIREFAQEDLVVASEEDDTRRRHANLFLALARQAEAELMGPRQVEWLERLEREHGNLRAALEWSIETKEFKVGLQLAAAIWRFWYIHGHLTEGRAWLTKVLALSSEESTLRAQALNGAGWLAQIQGDYSSSSAFFEESLMIFRKFEDKRGIASCLNNLGVIASDAGNYEKAFALYKECLSLSREVGEPTASVLNNLALLSQRKGDYKEARSLHEESLSVKRKMGDKRGVAATLLNLGNLARDEGDLAAARAFYEESLIQFRDLGDKRGIAYSLNNLAFVALGLNDLATASEHFQESLPLFRELGDKLGIASCLHGKAGLASAQGDCDSAMQLYQESLGLRNQLGDMEGLVESLEGLSAVFSARGEAKRAAVLLGASEALREKIGITLPPADRPEYERTLSRTRQVLGESSFEAERTLGRSMSLVNTIAHALQGHGG